MLQPLLVVVVRTVYNKLPGVALEKPRSTCGYTLNYFLSKKQKVLDVNRMKLRTTKNLFWELAR